MSENSEDTITKILELLNTKNLNIQKRIKVLKCIQSECKVSDSSSSSQIKELVKLLFKFINEDVNPDYKEVTLHYEKCLHVLTKQFHEGLELFQLLLKVDKRKRVRIIKMLNKLEQEWKAKLAEDPSTVPYMNDCLKMVNKNQMNWLAQPSMTNETLNETTSPDNPDNLLVEYNLQFLTDLYSYSLKKPKFDVEKFHMLVLEKVMLLGYMGNKKQRSVAIPLILEAMKTSFPSYIKVNHSNLWIEYKLSLQKVYCPRMITLILASDPDWSILWQTSIQILGNEIHRGNELINNLLNVEEKAFKSSDMTVRRTAFEVWKVLIDGFATELTEIASPRRIKLLTIPLIAKNSKTETITLRKLEVWWHLLVKLLPAGSSFTTEQNKCLNQVIRQFLNFCFGPLGDTPLLSSKEEVLESPGKKYIQTRLCGIDALLQLMVINHKQHKEDLISRLDERMPHSIPIWIFQECYKSILHSVGEALLLLKNFDEKDVKNPMKICNILWSNLIAYSDECKSKITVYKELIKVTEEVFIHLNDPSFVDEFILNSVITELVRTSEVLQFKDDTFMNFLIKCLPTVLRSNDPKYHRYMATLVGYAVKPDPTPNIYHRDTLKMVYSLMTTIQSCLNEQTNNINQGCVYLLWCNVAELLIKYVETDGRINEGTDDIPTFDTLHSFLTFPLFNTFWNQPESLIKVSKLWKDLFKKFDARLSIIANVDPDEIINYLSSVMGLTLEQNSSCHIIISHCLDIIVSSFNYEKLLSKRKIPPIMDMIRKIITSNLNGTHAKEIEYSLASLDTLLLTIFNLNKVKTMEYLIYMKRVIDSILKLDFVNDDVEDKIVKTWENICLIIRGSVGSWTHHFLSKYEDTFLLSLKHENEDVSHQTKLLFSIEKNMDEDCQILFEKLNKEGQKITDEKKVDKAARRDSPVKSIKLTGTLVGRKTPSPVITNLKLLPSTAKIIVSSSKSITTLLKPMSSTAKPTSSTAKPTLSSGKSLTAPAKTIPLSAKAIVRTTKKKETHSLPKIDLETEDFVVIPNKSLPFNVNCLTEHQKESLKRRRDDIPALYNDLSQSESRDTQDLAEWFKDKKTELDTSDSKKEKDIDANKENKVESQSSNLFEDLPPKITDDDIDAGANNDADADTDTDNTVFEDDKAQSDDEATTSGQSDDESHSEAAQHVAKKLNFEEFPDNTDSNLAKTNKQKAAKTCQVSSSLPADINLRTLRSRSLVNSPQKIDQKPKTLKRKLEDLDEPEISSSLVKRSRRGNLTPSLDYESSSEVDDNLSQRTRKEIERLKIDMAFDMKTPTKSRIKANDFIYDCTIKRDNNFRAKSFRTIGLSKCNDESQEIISGGKKRKAKVELGKQKKSVRIEDPLSSPETPKTSPRKSKASDEGAGDKTGDDDVGMNNGNGNHVDEDDEVVHSSQNSNPLLRSPLSKKVHRNIEKRGLSPTTRNSALLIVSPQKSPTKNHAEVSSSDKKSDVSPNTSPTKPLKVARSKCFMQQGRAAHMLGLVTKGKSLDKEMLDKIGVENDAVKKINSKDEVDLVPISRKDRLKDPEKIGSPSSSRQEKIFSNMKSKKICEEKDNSDADADDKTDDEDSKSKESNDESDVMNMLGWSDYEYSGQCTPNSSILKLKKAENGDPDDSFVKKKRVSFSDPPVSRKMSYKVEDEDEEKSRKALPKASMMKIKMKMKTTKINKNKVIPKNCFLSTVVLEKKDFKIPRTELVCLDSADVSKKEEDKPEENQTDPLQIDTKAVDNEKKDADCSDGESKADDDDEDPANVSNDIPSSMSSDSEMDEAPAALNFSQPELLDSVNPIFSDLVGSNEQIASIIPDLVAPLWQKNLDSILKDRKIETVGDLARLTEREVSRLPVKGNNAKRKIEFIKMVLKKFLEAQLPSSSKDEVENTTVGNSQSNQLEKEPTTEDNSKEEEEQRPKVVETKSVEVQVGSKEFLDSLNEDEILEIVMKNCSYEKLLQAIKPKMTSEMMKGKTLKLMGVEVNTFKPEIFLTTVCNEHGLDKVLDYLAQIFTKKADFYTEVYKKYCAKLDVADIINPLNTADLKQAISNRFSSNDICEILSNVLNAEEKKGADAQIDRLSTFNILLRRMKIDSIITYMVENDILNDISIPPSISLDMAVQGNQPDVILQALKTQYPNFNDLVPQNVSLDNVTAVIKQNDFNQEQMLDIAKVVASKLDAKQILNLYHELLSEKLKQ